MRIKSSDSCFKYIYIARIQKSMLYFLNSVTIMNVSITKFIYFLSITFALMLYRDYQWSAIHSNQNNFKPAVVDSRLLLMMLAAFDLDPQELVLDLAVACPDLHTVRIHSDQHFAGRDTWIVLGEPLVMSVGALEACLAEASPVVAVPGAYPVLVPFDRGLLPVKAVLGSFRGSWGWVVCQAVRSRGSERVSAVVPLGVAEVVVAGLLPGNLNNANSGDTCFFFFNEFSLHESFQEQLNNDERFSERYV